MFFGRLRRPSVIDEVGVQMRVELVTDPEGACVPVTVRTAFGDFRFEDAMSAQRSGRSLTVGLVRTAPRAEYPQVERQSLGDGRYRVAAGVAWEFEIVEAQVESVSVVGLGILSYDIHGVVVLDGVERRIRIVCCEGYAIYRLS